MNHSLYILKRSLAVLCFTGLALLGAGLGTAQAGEDGKTYPGTMCRPADMDSPDVRYFGYGLIYNQSTTRGLLIYCPIVRDMFGGKSRWTKVVISYQNPDPAKKIRCTMENRGWDGRLLKSRGNNSGRKANDQMRIYGDRSGAGTAIYTLWCSLPPSPGPGKGIPGISLIKVHEAD